MIVMPSGIGFYCRGLSAETHGTPDQMARRMADCGVRHAWLLVCWQDDKGNFASNRGRLRAYAEALLRRGIGVGLWGFPRAGHETAFVDRFVQASEEVKGLETWWLIDPEVFYKWKGGGTPLGTFTLQTEFSAAARASGQQNFRTAAAESLVRQLRTAAQARGGKGIGVTSYGMVDYHRNFPWAAFAKLAPGGFGSPQLYTVSPAEVDRGIASWRRHGWSVQLASVPTFGPKSGAALDDHLMKFVDGNEGISGFLFWSWMQTDAAERATIARWAERFARGICSLSPAPAR